MSTPSSSAVHRESLPASPFRFTAFGLLVALCGMMAPVKLNVFGDLFVAELMLPVVAFVALTRARTVAGIWDDPVFRRLVLAGIVTLAGYMLSDLANGSRPDQYLRGWGRVALVVSDLLSLSILLRESKYNLWWFILGSGIGNIAYLVAAAAPLFAKWKGGYAEPVMFVVAALGAFLPTRLLSVGLSVLGLFSVWADFRSFGAICMGVAAIVWIRARERKNTNHPSQNLAVIIKLSLAVAVVAVTVSAALTYTTTEEYANRRLESNSGREAAIEVGIQAIMQSPIIGYGSWAENKELVSMFWKRQDELSRGSKRAAVKTAVVFTPHSQILHAWLEGGILGAALMFVLLYYLPTTLYWLVQARSFDRLSPILLYLLVIVSWNLIMSPFSGGHRLGLAVGSAVIVMLQREKRAMEQLAPAAVDVAVSTESISIKTMPATLPCLSGLQRAERKLLNRKETLVLSRRQPVVRSSIGLP